MLQQLEERQEEEGERLHVVAGDGRRTADGPDHRHSATATVMKARNGHSRPRRENVHERDDRHGCQRTSDRDVDREVDVIPQFGRKEAGDGGGCSGQRIEHREGKGSEVFGGHFRGTRSPARKVSILRRERSVRRRPKTDAGRPELPAGRCAPGRSPPRRRARHPDREQGAGQQVGAKPPTLESEEGTKAGGHGDVDVDADPRREHVPGTAQEQHQDRRNTASQSPTRRLPRTNSRMLIDRTRDRLTRRNGRWSLPRVSGLPRR